jgi:hypothetical protein
MQNVRNLEPLYFDILERKRNNDAAMQLELAQAAYQERVETCCAQDNTVMDAAGAEGARGRT